MSISKKNQPTKIVDSRIKLLSGANICFLKSGFAATSLDDIAAECKVVKQTIYNHFQTKEALFHESVDYLMQGLVIDLDQTWLDDEPHAFFSKMGQLNLALLQNKRMTDFLQLAVKESKSFPALQSMYSVTIPAPMLAFVSTYVQLKTSASKEKCDILSWAFRAAINGYATLFNTNQLTAPSHPRPANFILDLATTFTALVKDISEAPMVIPAENLLPQTLVHETFAEEFIFDGTTQKLTTNQLAIIKAAFKIFAEKGYLETTMLDIAAAANVSKQTVYKHFKSKDELFKTFCQTYLGRLCFKCELIAEQQTQSDKFLLKGAQCLFALASHDWFLKLFRTMISESYFFPVEANHALIFLFTLAGELSSFELPANSEVEAPLSTLNSSLILAIHSLAGNFVLSRQIFQLNGSVTVSESEITDFLLRLHAMMN